ncbi:MAG: D-cysteine desulfhydrase family protein [Planctomycetota bacterium]|nr:MAG: D-cysteine desulfhydrase family protein [Planctomycetota bacterium]
MGDFNFPERIPLANLPTRIEKMERLAKHLGGPMIYVKRDDLTGAALSGNKVRKLEFVLQDALNKGATTVLTCGGVQSNHCRATAVAARRLGLRPLLLLRGEKPERCEGNLFMDGMLGAEVRYVTPEQYEAADDIMAGIIEELESKGEVGYAIPEGASNALGAMGYVNAAREISEQMHANPGEFDFDYIVHATGSGGTGAGLIAGAELFNLPCRVLGVNVCRDEQYFVNKIGGILADVRRTYNVPVEFTGDGIEIIDGYVGRGYGLNTPEELAFIRMAAEMEGLFFDGTYTGKALFALADQIKKGRFDKRDKILFIHTGGIFSLFAKCSEFALC